MKKLGDLLITLSSITALFGVFGVVLGNWQLFIICFLIAMLMAVTGYQIAGGRENPEIYAEMGPV